MPDFDYGAVTQMRQVFPGRAQDVFDSNGNNVRLNLNDASKRKKNR